MRRIALIAGVVTTFAASALALAAVSDRQLSVRAIDATVRAGETARYAVTLAAPAPVRATRLPRGATAVLRGAGRRVVLSVRTPAALRPGTYTLRVDARGASVPVTLAVRSALTATAAATTTVAKLASPLTGLAPGVQLPVDISITNPQTFAVRLDALSVTVTGVSGARITASTPCGTGDFGVTQMATMPATTIPAGATRSLSQLGVAAAQRPKLAMLNRAVSQDGCKGATVALQFATTVRQ